LDLRQYPGVGPVYIAIRCHPVALFTLSPVSQGLALLRLHAILGGMRGVILTILAIPSHRGGWNSQAQRKRTGQCGFLGNAHGVSPLVLFWIRTYAGAVSRMGNLCILARL